MAVTCKNCGGAHAIWECKRPATKSTGARPLRALIGADAQAHTEVEARKQVQALPVDTKPPQGSKGLSDDGREVTLQRPVEGTAGSFNGRTAPFDGVNAGSTPAPASKFDKKAWSRAYMKIWMRNKRAKLKLERENAK